MFTATMPLSGGPEQWARALEGLVESNLVEIRRARAHDSVLPELYQAARAGKVRYMEEEKEEWRTIADVLKAGQGDCEDLSAWRVAELRAAGETKARPVIKRTGITRYHALVMRGSGQVEDPTKILLKMQKRKVAGPMENRTLSWRVEPLPGGGYQGWVSVPLLDGTRRVLGATGIDPAAALFAAAGDAMPASMPAVQELIRKGLEAQGAAQAPVSALLPTSLPAGSPPEAQAALLVLRLLTHPKIKSKVKKAWGKLKRKLRIRGYSGGIETLLGACYGR